ncbi:helix-turn-helix domain-containing protein [Merismopedia glauca]|nr:helix-turn-helix transcriptional regulator [Merismopedia glauca]
MGKMPVCATSQNPTGLWTRAGLERLGKIVAQARNARGWSQREAIRLIAEKTGRTISDKTLSNLENGVGEPKYSTLAIVAAAELVRDAETGRVLTVHDFCDIASEEWIPAQIGTETEPNLWIPSALEWARLSSLLNQSMEIGGINIESVSEKSGVSLVQIRALVENQAGYSLWIDTLAKLCPLLFQVEQWSGTTAAIASNSRTYAGRVEDLLKDLKR